MTTTTRKTGLKTPKMLVGAVLLATLSLTSVTQAGERLDRIEETKVLRVGTPGDYRPFAMKEGDAYVGHDIDLARALAAAAGWKIEIVPTTWKKLSEDLKADRFDVAVGGITQTVARLKLGAFLPGYAPFGKVALVPEAKKDRFTTPESLNQPDVRVIKNPGGTNEQYVLEHLTKAQVTTHEKNAEIPGMIAQGKGDVMITETMEAKLYVKKYPGKLHAAFLDHPLTPMNVMGFWMPADDAEYLRVMQYLWDMTGLRGDRAKLEATWLQ